MKQVTDQAVLEQLEGGARTFARPPKAALSIGPADFATMLKAAFVDNPADKIRIYAESRFPGDPKAIERYGVVDGEIVFADDDGNLHREEPGGLSGMVKSIVAGIPSKGLPILGGVAGGIAGATSGIFTGGAGTIPGAVGGAMAGAGGGEAVRKLVANLLLGEHQTVSGNLGAIGKETSLAGGGEVLGFGGAKALESARLARDIGRYNPLDAERLIATGKKFGIELNPAQATNLTSLKARHDLLANNPYSSDIIEEGLKKQAQQANVAGYKFLDDVSLTQGARLAGLRGKEAATEIIAELRKERTAKARPFYEKAFSYPIKDTSWLLEYANTPSMKEAVAIAKKLAADERIDLGDPMSTAQGLHFVKMAFDTMLKEPPRTGVQAFNRRAVANMRAKVYDFLNEMTEGNYGAANRVYSAWSDQLNRVSKGLIEGVADLKERSLAKAARIFFSPDVAPEDVAFSRKLFAKHGRTDEWNALLRSYLQEAFENAGRQFSTTGGMKSQAPKFYAQMMGNPRQAAILKNAMSLEQWDNFTQLMDVFEALSRTPGRGGSQTYGRGAEEAAMRRESGAGIIGQGAGLLSPHTLGERMSQFLADVRMGKYAENMARVITSKDAMKELKQLRKLDPRDEKFIAGLSALLGGASGLAASGPTQP